jgi:hypothetical protein
MPQYPTDTAEIRADERRRLRATVKNLMARRLIDGKIPRWQFCRHRRRYIWVRCVEGGRPGAVVWVDTIYQPDGRGSRRYVGASLWLDRTLAITAGPGDWFTPRDAIDAGEQLGAFADCWMDHDTPPQPPGWTHYVRQQRDCWSCVTRDHIHLFVAQVPYGDPRGCVYVAAVDGDYLRDASGVPIPHCNPVDAMRAAEIEARRRGHDLCAPTQLPIFT